MLLAYHILCKEGAATAEELENRVERYVFDNFGASIEFEVTHLCCARPHGSAPSQEPLHPLPLLRCWEFCVDTMPLVLQAEDALEKVVHSQLATTKAVARQGTVYTAVHAKLASTRLRDELIALTDTPGDGLKIKNLFRAEAEHDWGEAHEDASEEEHRLSHALLSPSPEKASPSIRDLRRPSSSRKRATKKKADGDAPQSPGKRRKVQQRAAAPKRKRGVSST